MKNPASILALAAMALAAGFAAPAIAQTALPEAAPAPALTANVGVFSEYRFRGIAQTFGKPGMLDAGKGVAVLSVSSTF